MFTFLSLKDTPVIVLLYKFTTGNLILQLQLARSAALRDGLE